jgi:YD repeat-containing protein
MRGAGRRAGARALAVLVACCAVGLVGAAAGASGEALSSPAGSGSPSSPLESSLVVPEVQSLDGGQQALNAGEAQLSNPEAVAEREASRTRFEGLGGAQAMRLVSEAFPALVSKQDGGPPPLAAGEKSLGFKSANVEQIETGSGDVGVVQSTAPVAVSSGNGHWDAVNLAPQEAGAGFEAQRPLVAVRLPKHLGEGAQIPSIGVSLTPLDANGNPLGGSEGVADGQGVVFTNTQTDTDTVLKSSLFGVEATAVLRSVASPEALYYRVGLPQGARLVASPDGLGAEVVDEGVVIATVKPPTASDTEGTAVPVSMSVSHGDTLVVNVSRGGSFRYPIQVDPELSGYWQEWSNVVAGNWEFNEWIGYTHEISGAELRMKHEPGSFANNDYAIWSEKTKGYTKIFDVYVKDELYPWSAPEGKRNTPGWLRSYIEVYKSGGGTEGSLELSGSPYRSEGTVCGAAGCAAAGTDAEGNAFSFTLTTKEAGSTGEQFYAHAEQVSTGIAQEYGKHSTVSYNTGSSEIEGAPNVLTGGGTWLGPNAGKLEYTSRDGGLGVSESAVEVKGSSGWEKVGGKNYLPTSGCAGIQCEENQHEVLSWKGLTNNGAKPLPEPEAHIRVGAQSYMPYSSSTEHGEGETTLKVDAKHPHGITVSGLPAKGTEGKELTLGEGPAHLVAEASEGEGTTPSSGMKEIRLGIDGTEIGHGGGSCAPGPCVAAAQWSLKGSEFGAGAHTLTVIAESNTGVVESAEYTLNVYAASPVAAGPGSVNPESGDFALEASDVSLSGGMGSLVLSRHYDSRNLKEGEEGPFGAPWNASLGSLASLEVLPEGSVMVVGPTGLSFFKAKSGGGFEAPQGDANLELKYEASYEGKPAYLFKNAKDDTTTVFTLPEHASSWMPTVSKGPIATDTTTDEYRTVAVTSDKYIVQPTLELAPHPNLECAKEHWHAGCRALEFVYDESTTAGGEAEGEWGGYKNRLKEVIAVAYNPASKAIVKTPVAAYLYDKQGRLREEWNPSVKPALKTTYGYDGEGHVTAVAPPGQQPWLLHYGTTAQDTTPGRLLSVGRLGVKTALWNGEVLKNTGVPTLSSTSPLIGTTLSVASGSWSTSSVLFGYQWEDCNSSGAECAVIPGAVNASYTPPARDAGYTLVAQVTAGDAWGAVTSSTVASKAIAMPAPAYSSVFGTTGSESEKLSKPAGVAVDSEGNVWVADRAGNRVEKFSASGGFLASYAPDSMLEPAGVAFSATNGNVYVTNRGRDRVDQLSLSGTLVRSFGGEGSALGKLNHPNQVAIDSHGDVWVADTSNGRVDEFSVAGTYLGSAWGGSGNGVGTGQLQAPVGVAECGGTLYVADETANDVQELTATGGYIGRYGAKGTGNGEFVQPSQVACEPVGNDVYIVDKGNSRIQEFNGSGSFLNKFGISGSGEGAFSAPVGIAVGASGVVYVGDSGNNRISKWKATYSTNNPLPTPPALTENPASTIEYNVPLSGSGLPNMTSGEVSKWAQKDDPVEGTAVFPSDEPMGWPAANYKRASVSYEDEQMRTVNVASPSGTTPTEAISTSEYNSQNEVVRALSAENRATALKESNPAAASELLDTKSTYSEGELTDTWGPQHTVKLAKGKTESNETVLARNHVKYSYDEGAPKGEEYELVTKVVDGAETASKEEFDQRTSITSYGGQGGLGWTLREPTSVTIDPSGLSLTRTTIYDPSTGNATETRSPVGSSGHPSRALDYLSRFGSRGSGNGQFFGPAGNAVDAGGNVWVADFGGSRIEKFSSSGAFVASYGASGSGAGQFVAPSGIAVDQSSGNVFVVDHGNNRVEEFSSSGVFVRVFGFGVGDGKEEFEICTSGCRAGIAGSGSGQFHSPHGIAVDANGNVWVVDSENTRIEEFSSTGAFVAAYGSWGTGNGNFKYPWGIAVSGDRLYVSDDGNYRVEEFSTSGTYIAQFGSHGTGNGQFEMATSIGIDPVSSGVYVVDSTADRVQEFTPAGTFVAAFGSEGTGNGQFKEPEGITVNTSGVVYVTDSENDRIDTWEPAPRDGNEGAHDTRTIYYTAKSEAEVAICREHPEWVNLPCQTMPLAQPGIKGLPELPITTIAYNMWEQPEIITEHFGTVERKKLTTFDESGRPLKTEETSSNDQPLPAVTDAYNEHTGALETQSTKVGETTKTITSIANTLGQSERYTDADGNTAEYKRDIDGRVTEITDGSEEAIKKDGYTGWQKYHYDETTGELTTLEDSAAKTFTAGYTIGGSIAKETYPNGMTAYYTINPAGQDTAVEYKKETHCSEKCVWFSDRVVPSIHGETINQSSALSEETYSYDAVARLNQVQETPAGGGCKTRLYAYEEEGNRTSLTTREPAAENKCATEGGTVERHTYDSANHLTDSGVTYEAFGNTTALPAGDAGGTALTSSFYVDNQVYKQTQNGTTIEYQTDPEDRTRETITSDGAETPKVISHYDGPGNALAWTLEPTSGKWTRNIPGIDGALTATQTNTTAPVLLLHDLQGNVVAEASMSETETKLLKTYNPTEYGVPTNKEAPPKYAWLGADGLTSELPSGTITQDGSTYVPQTGRALQTEPIELPLPVKYYNPYERPNAEGATWGPIASALRLAESTAAERAKEGAANPPGAIPIPGGGESQELLGTATDQRPDGEGAHVAVGEPVIECSLKAHYPHQSSHNPTTVNFEIWLECTGTVEDIRLRASLYRDHKLVGETGYVVKGSGVFAKENIAVPCGDGLYQGWGYADWELPGDYAGKRKNKGWSKAVMITCV